MKKISMGSDHAGFKLKEELKNHLILNGYEVIDKGTYNSERTNYGNFGIEVGKSIKNKETNMGVLVCGSGIGISIAANRIKGVRAARVFDVEDAKLTRQHNDANVIVFGERMKYKDSPKNMLDAFLKEGFEGGRHKERIEELDK